MKELHFKNLEQDLHESNTKETFFPQQVTCDIKPRTTH